MSGKCNEFSRRDRCTRFAYSDEREPWTFQIWPCLTQGVLRRPASTNPEDPRSSLPHHAHKRRWRHPQSLSEVGGGQYATVQLSDNVTIHETIIQRCFLDVLLYFELLSSTFKSNDEMISEMIYDTIPRRSKG